MAATPVSICSNALLMLGDKPISDFAEQGDRAVLAANLWEPVRDHVLRAHPWNCAVKRVELAPDTDRPAFDWAFQFTLPADYLRALSIGPRGQEGEYRIEGRKILCDDNPCALRYIFRNENTGSWDASLVWAATMVMKDIFTYGITQSGNLEQMVEATVARVVQQARSADGQEETSEQLGDNPLLAARFVGHRLWG